jgi:hypothetical protein
MRISLGRLLRQATVIGGLAFGASACSPVLGQAQANSGCLMADTVHVPTHLDYLRRLVSDTDSAAVEVRNAFELPLTSPSKVTLVTRNNTCASAAAALNTVVGTPGQIRQVWVYALGSNYAVEDPAIPVEPAGYPIFLFTSKWVPKPVLMY